MAVEREDVERAKEIIEKAQRDLGILSSGQRRDLLMDNTQWSSAFCAEVVKYLRSWRN